jgi:hypothetical protein
MHANTVLQNSPVMFKLRLGNHSIEATEVIIN